jgi:hypothetical protein
VTMLIDLQVSDVCVRRPSVDISIVLVCWNNKNYLGPCLRSLYDVTRLLS